ncbi:MAG: hypothetical protein ACOCXJ_08000 [Planctomycetota bacterium]
MPALHAAVGEPTLNAASTPSTEAVVLGEHLYLVGVDADHGQELWHSTRSSTATDRASTVGRFRGRRGLWVSDGRTCSGDRIRWDDLDPSQSHRVVLQVTGDG